MRLHVFNEREQKWLKVSQIIYEWNTFYENIVPTIVTLTDQDIVQMLPNQKTYEFKLI